jgi:hypothetical protein
MIVQLNIERLAPGTYQVHCSGAPDQPTTHNSIADGLRKYGADIPSDFAKFVNIEYGGCHLETMPVESLELAADKLADRLMQLIAALHAAA